MDKFHCLRQLSPVPVIAILPFISCILRVSRAMVPRANSTMLRTVHNDSDAQAEAASAQRKAQARRSQVRKAQIQHRQRKANYTKQLEMDIAKLGEMVERTENDCHKLRSENESMRHRLLANSSRPHHHISSSELQQLLDPTMFTTTSSLPAPPLSTTPYYLSACPDS
ncbi:hypothetical protein F5X96DRAFT_636430 [Biscogniauxia mediterranea]|nr:hypothetical protein F5X96DRAFT_636430 [Biscogniauxia mediterranea]